MPSSRIVLLICLVLGLLQGCGGGGAGDGGAPPQGAVPPAPPPAAPAPLPLPTQTSVTLQSEPGDPLGRGLSYRYTRADAVISVSNDQNRLIVQVQGDEAWTGVFQTGGASELKPGEYLAMERYVDGIDRAKSAMTWWGNGRSCTTASGWAIVDSVKYEHFQLTEISLRFARNCNGAAAALRGEVKYFASDLSAPGAPVTPVPTDLWRPPASVTATAGNYVYFDSTEGDHVGLGKKVLFDARSAEIEVLSFPADFYNPGELVTVAVRAEDAWVAELKGVVSRGHLVPGYYPGIKGSRFFNTTKGGMSWTAAGRGCSNSTGWFVVDAVDYTRDGTLTRLDLRFAQHCEGRAAPLYGAVHYVYAEPAAVSPPISRGGSWRAPAALVPATDNFLYVESELNDPLGQVRTELQTSRNAGFEVGMEGRELVIYGHGDRRRGIRFQPPARFTQIVPGIYENITTPPGDTASYGALNVVEGNYGCDTERGWVSVDDATYAGNQLVALELRYEQVCASGVPGVKLRRGHLRWRAGVSDAFPGPVQPVPATFWRPAVVLPVGNSLYMTSDPSAFVGIGEVLYTPLDSDITVKEKDGRLDISVRGDTTWDGSFQTMRTAGKILPGYYPGLTEGYRPARGSLHWGGNARGCQSVSGVVVDSAEYVGDRLSELKMRFEQHCQLGPGALRAQLHWFASDTRQPRGPQLPAPDLWRAPAGALPQGGNYLYVESVWQRPSPTKKTYLFTPGNGTFFTQSIENYHDIPGSYFSIDADKGTYEGGRYRLEFQTMRSLSQLQPGFYGHLLRQGFHNTAFGGLELISQEGGKCLESMGWMVLDKTVYNGGRLSAVHGHFLYYCTEDPSMYDQGEFNWEAEPSSQARAVGRQLR